MTRKEAIKWLIRPVATSTEIGEVKQKEFEAYNMAIEALSADTVQDGCNNIKRYPNCQMRTSLGNCDAIGGFCTSINAPICDAFHKLVDAVHGEWIDTGNWMGIECSRCKCHSRYVTPFCPQCGARMKGGVE